MNEQAASTAQPDDERFMRLALALGRRNLGNTWPNPSVGAVIVKDGAVIARGWTQEGGRPHAEVEALRRARKATQGTTMYVSLEPCSHQGKTPPCADAIIRAGIARVVSAMEDPNPEVAGQGHERLRAKGITVEVGLGAEEAQRIHAGHVMRVTKGRPHVTLKLAISADGKAGLAGRRPALISGEAARERVFQIRAANDAILVGIGTVLSDDPQLTCRLPGMFERSPVRIVLDEDLRLPLATSVVATVRETPTWVFTSHRPSAIAEEILPAEGLQGLPRRRRQWPARPEANSRKTCGTGDHTVLGRGWADCCIEPCCGESCGRSNSAARRKDYWRYGDRPAGGYAA